MIMMTAGKFLNTYEFEGEERGKLVCISDADIIELMEEYAKHYHQSKVNNGVLDDVIKCDDCGSDDIYKGFKDNMCNNCQNFF